MRTLFVVALCCSSCVFSVHSLTDADLGVGGDDMGFGEPDLAGTPPGDLAGADLAAGLDMAHPDLTVSHVPAHYFTDGTCDLVVNSSIDTSSRMVDGAAVPTGCVFAADTESSGASSLAVAVLAVHSVVFNNTVTVTGSVPLVVVAHTTIDVVGVIDGSANLATPGPGGFGSSAGPGQGPNGVHGAGLNNTADSGGSGGSYGTVGGIGGVGLYNGAGTPAQTAGTGYGTALLPTSVPAGSGGGNGHSEGCTPAGNGGAGGGSIQLSAGTSITIEASGAIDVGGGGGGLGCLMGSTNEGSGGGGGSGGAIFLESPMVTVNGGLWANGGAGGGGGSGNVNDTAGGDGNNGTRSQTAAVGGTSGGAYGGVGGVGYAGTTVAGRGGQDSTSNPPIANGGGGGGGAGRIVVRTRGNASITMANVSPGPALDTAIP